MSTEKADYGLDAPTLVYGFLIGGPVLIAMGFAARYVPGFATLGTTSIISGALCIVEAGLMWRSSRVGKLRERERLLDALQLSGSERVLDLGCGHGLVLIGAARRLPSGRAVGIDLWSQNDQAKNSREATLANARLEGVADRVEVHDGDMRKLPFPDGSFDRVTASMSIHNISSRAGRREAIQEAVRVLKPGGRLALLDFKAVGEYARELKAAGMRDVMELPPSLQMFPPVRTVTAVKPAAG